MGGTPLGSNDLRAIAAEARAAGNQVPMTTESSGVPGVSQQQRVATDGRPQPSSPSESVSRQSKPPRPSGSLQKGSSGTLRASSSSSSRPGSASNSGQRSGN